jgi:hypothetical protein
MLHLRVFSGGERILYLDAQTANGALDLRVAEHDLLGAQVASLFDDGGLGSAQRMRPVVLGLSSDPGQPLIDESSILPSADIIGVIDPARKDELARRAASAFEPAQNAAAGRLKKLKLNRPAGLLLDDDRA